MVAAIAVIVPLISALTAGGNDAVVKPAEQAAVVTPAEQAAAVDVARSTTPTPPPTNPGTTPPSTSAPTPTPTPASTAAADTAGPLTTETTKTVGLAAVVPAAPTEKAAAAKVDPNCAKEGHSALVDRKKQRTWLCTDGVRGEAMPMTSAWSMPDPGTYKVYAKDLKATSNFGGHFSRMTHFVAFSYGKRTGARVAFHSLPKLNNGKYVQPESSVGDLGRRGESNGCIRMLDSDIVKVWDHLKIGDPVIVLN